MDGDAPASAQIVWLLFLKIFDDKEQLTVVQLQIAAATWFRWSNSGPMPRASPAELIDFV